MNVPGGRQQLKRIKLDKGGDEHASMVMRFDDLWLFMIEGNNLPSFKFELLVKSIDLFNPFPYEKVKLSDDSHL